MSDPGQFAVAKVVGLPFPLLIPSEVCFWLAICAIRTIRRYIRLEILAKGYAKFVAGDCGQELSNSRISYYAALIDNVIEPQSLQWQANNPALILGFWKQAISGYGSSGRRESGEGDGTQMVAKGIPRSCSAAIRPNHKKSWRSYRQFGPTLWMVASLSIDGFLAPWTIATSEWYSKLLG